MRNWKILGGFIALAAVALTGAAMVKAHSPEGVIGTGTVSRHVHVQRTVPVYESGNGGSFSLIKDANANTMTPPYKQWESLNVAAGAIITSPVIDVTGCDDVNVFADNVAGGNTRALTITFYASDGTTALWTAPAASLTTGLNWSYLISRYSSAQAAAAHSTVVAAMPGPKIGAVLAAAGSAVGSLAIYCR